MKNNKFDVMTSISVAGSLIALLIGSGFATGQEIMQYFATYGYWGIATVLVVLICLIFISLYLVGMGNKYKYQPANLIYPHMFGDTIGKIMDYYVIFFIYLSFIVMLAGARATGFEQYNISGYWFVIIFAMIVAGSVFFGLDRLVDIIGTIGPIIILLTLIVAVWSIVDNAERIPGAMNRLVELKEAGLLQRASSNWLFSAGSYIGFVTWWLISFLMNLGIDDKVFKETKVEVLWGSIVFAIATLIVAFAIFIQLDQLYDSQIPTLVLAQDLSPLLANIYSITVILGIYTTAVTLLWTVVARFFEEGSKAYRLACLLITVLGLIFAVLIDFNILVNYVYVINGYLGIIFILVAVIYTYREKLKLF